MSKESNGFEEMADFLGTLSQVTEPVSKESLEAAAQYYSKKLIPNIPKSLRNKKHMRDQVKVAIEKDKVVVLFDDDAYYWRFVENGTKRSRAYHFASGTYEKNKAAIENIMTEKILKEFEK